MKAGPSHNNNRDKTFSFCKTVACVIIHLALRVGENIIGAPTPHKNKKK